MLTRLLLLTSLAFVKCSLGALVTISSNDAGEVALFQAGAKIETFESLQGHNTETDGTPIPTVSQLDNQLKASNGIFFTSGGNTPVAVLDLTKLDTAHSGKNVISPLEINTDLLCATKSSCFMEVFFTEPTNKFGAWFDQGDAQIIIFWTDNTSDIINADRGKFTGGVDTSRTIDHVSLFVRNGGPLRIDDVTYSGDVSTDAPEPTTFALMATALLGFGVIRRKLL